MHADRVLPLMYAIASMCGRSASRPRHCRPLSMERVEERLKESAGVNKTKSRLTALCSYRLLRRQSVDLAASTGRKRSTDLPEQAETVEDFSCSCDTLTSNFVPYPHSGGRCYGRGVLDSPGNRHPINSLEDLHGGKRTTRNLSEFVWTLSKAYVLAPTRRPRPEKNCIRHGKLGTPSGEYCATVLSHT